MSANEKAARRKSGSRDKWEVYKARQSLDVNDEANVPQVARRTDDCSDDHHLDDEECHGFSEPLSPIGPYTPLSSNKAHLLPPNNTPVGGRAGSANGGFAPELDAEGFASDFVSPVGDHIGDMQLWSPCSSVSASPVIVRAAKAPPPSPVNNSMSLHLGVSIGLSSLQRDECDGAIAARRRVPGGGYADKTRDDECVPLSPVGGMPVTPVGAALYTPPPNTPLGGKHGALSNYLDFVDSPDHIGDRGAIGIDAIHATKPVYLDG
jgi:hypothetical protein